MTKQSRYQNSNQRIGVIYHITAHFANDFFLSFFAPVLPVLITQMGLLKVQAGILNLGLELSALSMPLIGRIADRKDVRNYMALTPIITALCMTSLGITSSFTLLFVLLLVGGFSIYFYHAIGPADVAEVSGQGLGRLMAIWNIAGQVAFMIGPLVVTWVITRFSIHQMPWLSIPGFIIAVALFVIQQTSKTKNNYRKEKNPEAQESRSTNTDNNIFRQFLPITAIIIFIALSRSCAYAYLPVYIVERGGSLWMSGFAISLYFGAGIFGNYLGGMLHDRIGSKWVVGISLVGFAVFFTSTIFTMGITQLMLIAFMGVFSFMLMPTVMAMLAENNPGDRSLTNGLFLGLSYGVIALAGVLAGYLLDNFQTVTIFLISAVLALAAILFVPFLVEKSNAPQ